MNVLPSVSSGRKMGSKAYTPGSIGNPQRVLTEIKESGAIAKIRI